MIYFGLQARRLYSPPPIPMALKQTRQPISWLVLIAFLFATLAPALATSLGGQSASRTIWTQLCSVDGPELIAIEVDGEPSDAARLMADGQQGHCLLCFQPTTFSHGESVTPHQRNVAVLRVVLPETPPHRSAAGWNTPLARAPPLFS